MTRWKQSIQKGVKIVLLYACTLAVICTAGMGWLYLAGLLPQERISRNYALSVTQLEAEGYAPFILNQYRADSRLNNYTELLILHYSAYMDTQKMPLSLATPLRFLYSSPTSQ